jgi:ribosome-associated translation inhibitor RaiA
MRIKVSAPGNHLKPKTIDNIEKDLEKIDRRLSEHEDVNAEVRVSEHSGNPPGFHITFELKYGRNHLIAKTEDPDLFRAVRAAREDVLRQINDRSRGGHSSFAKGT